MHATQAGPQAPPAPVATRDRTWLRWILLTIVISVTVVTSNFFTPIAILVAFVVVVPFERLFPRHDYELRRPGLAVDLQYGLLLPLSKVLLFSLIFVVGFLSFAWVPGILFRPIVTLQPGWLIAIEAILLIDLIGYWVHRASHAVPALWRLHSIHHSSERLDWIAGIRNHPLDGFIAGAPYAFIGAAGLSDGSALAFVGLIQVVASLFSHVNVRWRLRPLHWFVLTPEMHHWHHANEPDAYDRNFTNLLPIWDILFGTYYMPKDRRPSNYGIDEPMPPTLWGQFRAPLRRIKSPEVYPVGTTTMSTVPTPVGPSGYLPVASGQPVVQHYDPAYVAPVPYSWGQAPYPVGSYAPIPAPVSSAEDSWPVVPRTPPPDDPYGAPPSSGGSAF